MLDDARHFLRSRGLTANHCTVDKPPFIEGCGNQQTMVNGEISAPGPEEKENGSPGVDGAMNSECHSNSHHLPDNMSIPRIFVWSTADEGGIDRLTEKWQDYFAEMSQTRIPPGIEYLENLAHTLAARRSSLLWKSFAMADSLVSLTKLKEFISRPVRSSEALGVGFIFTGQGAAYNNMGVALSEFSVFRNTLQSYDTVLHELGCQWSVVGRLYVQSLMKRKTATSDESLTDNHQTSFDVKRPLLSFMIPSTVNHLLRPFR